MNLADLQSKTDQELAELGRQMGVISNGAPNKRHDLMRQVLQAFSEQDGQVLATGILSIVNDGYGFLKNGESSKGSADVYVSQSQIRRFSLRSGDEVAGHVRPPKDGERYFGLVRVEEVNGLPADEARSRPHFENLTPIFPNERIVLETDQKSLSGRVLDMVSPIGRGQRGMIVSPPKAGKTTLLKEIAYGITANSPEIHLMVALIGERPEEVTDMTRSVKGEVFLERAKRLVEAGANVVILLDSLTRLTRAYNLSLPTSGRTLSGGIDPVALYPPKRFFGAARNAEDGGSLTIIAACLVETGSRMDDVIYEEFKGTGNMEVHLDRKLADRRTYPAIDITRSGTRREELLLDEETLKQVWLLRRMVSMISTDSNRESSEATGKVLERLSKSKNNAEFLANLGKDN